MALQDRNNLISEPFVMSGDAEVVDGITIEASQGAITTGAVLGEVTADPGVYKLCVSTATDGSQLPVLLLATADVANSASQQAGMSAYRFGLFNEDALDFGSTTTLDSRIVLQTNFSITLRTALRYAGIRLVSASSLTGYENT